jgi:hypothetical protein
MPLIPQLHPSSSKLCQCTYPPLVRTTQLLTAMAATTGGHAGFDPGPWQLSARPSTVQHLVGVAHNSPQSAMTTAATGRSLPSFLQFSTVLMMSMPSVTCEQQGAGSVASE